MPKLPWLWGDDVADSKREMETLIWSMLFDELVERDLDRIISPSGQVYHMHISVKLVPTGAYEKRDDE